MAVLFLKEEVSILISLALVLQCSTVERDYFSHDWRNLTWDEARSHCQFCYEELVTVTPENIRTITQNLSSEHWIGLRKNFYRTGNASRFWSRWANGEALLFQNWYPGRPISSFIQSCICDCNTGTTTISSFTSATTDATTGATTDAATGATTDAATGATTDDATGATTDDATGATTDAATGATTDDATGATTDDATGATTDAATGATTDAATGATTDDATGATTDAATGATTDAATGATTDDATGATTDAAIPPVLVFEVGATTDAATGATRDATTGAAGTAGTRICASPWLLDSDAGTYIEDSCVAILRFGAWVEKSCSERLSFICYEERFNGKVSVTQITSESASLTWQRGPANTNHYHIEVKTDHADLMSIETGNLTHELVNLTAGTKHTVKVFPVKCGRHLNTQDTTFYTKPPKIENLTATNVTESSVFLKWDQPAGKVDFYIIEVQGVKHVKCAGEAKEVDGLLPGTLHTFTVFAGVRSNTTTPQSNTTQSEGANTTTYTKPGKVSNLTVTDNSHTSLRLSWLEPEGHYSAFRVMAMNDSGDMLYEKKVEETYVTVTDLPVSTRITINVWALTDNDTLEGEVSTIVDYTAPGAISDLVLDPSFDSMTANWVSEGSNSEEFITELLSDGQPIQTKNSTSPTVHFGNLSSATNYTVIVSVYSGHIKGPTLNSTNNTGALPPAYVDVFGITKNEITIQWAVPSNIKKFDFFVNATSKFWNQTISATVKGDKYTFKKLHPGTRYDIEVRTIVRKKWSEATRLSNCTVAEKREISLSMMCSSVHSLLCDNITTRAEALTEFRKQIRKHLGEDVFWVLEKTQNTTESTCFT